MKSILKSIFLIIKNKKAYIYWKAKRSGKKFHEHKRGAGYYLNIGLLGHNPVKQKWEVKMASGKCGIYELVDYDTFSDPSDMIKFSWWNFLGYKGFKLIHECTFEEFLSLYPHGKQNSKQ